MFTSVIHNKNKRLTNIVAVLLSVALIVGLQGCSSSSSSTPAAPIPNQDPSGLYKSGTGTLDGVNVSDIVAFVQGNRVIAFSITAHIMIDGTVNSVTGNDYDATVAIYKDGALSQSNVNVTGMVTNASSISGTLNGTGTGAGNFNLTFDPLYSRGASFARIDTTVTGDMSGDVINTMAGAATTNFGTETEPFYDFTSITAIFDTCGSNGSYTIPDSAINIYVMDEVLRKVDDPECTMSITPNYTGFAAVVDGTFTDGTLLYGVSNGTNAQFAILSK